MNSSCVYLRRTFSGHESGRSVRWSSSVLDRESQSSPNSVRHIAARNGKAGCLSAGANAAQPAGGCNSAPLLSKTAAVCAFLSVYVCVSSIKACVSLFAFCCPRGSFRSGQGKHGCCRKRCSAGSAAFSSAQTDQPIRISHQPPTALRLPAHRAPFWGSVLLN
jgi:hypothetical protein